MLDQSNDFWQGGLLRNKFEPCPLIGPDMSVITEEQTGGFVDLYQWCGVWSSWCNGSFIITVMKYVVLFYKDSREVGSTAFIIGYGFFKKHEFTKLLFLCCLQLQPSCHPSLYFRDGLRSVDFVLVWDDLLKQSNSEASQEKRKVFERNLQCEG